MIAVVNGGYVVNRPEEIKKLVANINPKLDLLDRRNNILFANSDVYPEFKSVGIDSNIYMPYTRYMRTLASNELFPDKSKWDFKFYGLGLIPLTYLPSCHPLYSNVDIYKEHLQGMLGIEVFDMPRTTLGGYLKNTSKKDLWIKKEDAMKAFPDLVKSWEDARPSVIAGKVDMLLAEFIGEE